MAKRKKIKSTNTMIATKRSALAVGSERRWRIWLAAGIIIAAGIAVYLNSFDGVFLYDDTKSIVENPHIRSLWPLSEAMSVPLANRGATVSGRPILSLSFAINYALFGKEPWGYHLVNLAIHIFAGLLLFGIVRRTLCLEKFRKHYGRGALWPALAAALLWIVHPVQSESVTYIVQRAESMMGMFFLLTLYCAIRGFQSGRRYLWYVPSILSCALGMGTKEVMVAAPVIVLLYDYIFISRSLKDSVRRRLVFYVVLAATWIIPVTQILLTREMISVDLQIIDPLKYALTQPGVILYYLKLSIWPSPLVMDYNWPTADSITDVFPAGFVILSMLVLTGWGLIRRRWFGFVGAWFFFILAPSSSFVPTAQNLHVHRMYLSLAAIIVPVVAVGKHLLQKMLAGRLDNRRLGVVGAGFVLVITAILGSLTYERNKAYQSAYALWSDNVENRPESKIAHFNFGLILDEEGKVEQAKAEYEHAIRIDPNYFDVRTNLGIIFANQGNLDRARNEFEHEIRINPNHIEARYNLGNVFLAQGDLAKATAEYEYAIGIQPGRTKSNLEAYINSHINLGAVLTQQGRPDKAMAYYEKALVIDPNNTIAMSNLALLLATCPDDNLHNGARAIKLAEQACNITGYRVPRLLDTLATTYAEAGRFAEAVETATKALDLAQLQKNSAAQIEQIRLRLEQYKAGRPYRRQP